MNDEDRSPRPLRYHLEQAQREAEEKLQDAYASGYVTDEELDERLELVNQAVGMGGIDIE